MTLVASHFERVKRRLQAEGHAARSFKHGLNRGQIREAFAREFLAQNMSSLWDIGTGEIIHKDATPEEDRPQIDIVVYNKKFPKLSLAVDIDLFFVEAVSSFIEIKSRLTKDNLRTSAASAKKVKSLAKLNSQGINPAGLVDQPRPYSFVFAYDGPRRIETVHNWLKDVAAEADYGIDSLRECTPAERSFFDHRFIDGVFVLGRGFVFLDSLPFESKIHQAIDMGYNISPREVWIYARERELLMLWAIVNEINRRLLWSESDLTDYFGIVNFMLDNAERSRVIEPESGFP